VLNIKLYTGGVLQTGWFAGLKPR